MTGGGRESDSGLPARVTTGARLDRRTVERVLARAAELQAGSAGSGELGDSLAESQLLEIAKEVGIDATNLRQALAEERTRADVPEESGWIARLSGPSRASASRVVRGEPKAVLAQLDNWMQKDECLRVLRRFPERIVWEGRDDVWAKLRVGFSFRGRKYDLIRADCVAGTTIGVESGSTIVRLDADLSGRRRSRIGFGAFLLGLGATATAVTVALPLAVEALALVPVAVGAGGGVLVARTHASTVTRVQLALEQILDRLEYVDQRAEGSLARVIERVTRPLLP